MLLQTYGKEIVALIVPFITWILNTRLRERARLQVAMPHGFIFRVQPSQVDPSGTQVPITQTVHTNSIVVYNAGRDTATRLEVVFSSMPMCINVWPSRHYEEHHEPDGRYILIFSSLSPSETLGCEILSVNSNLPQLTTVRSDQCTAQFVKLLPQPVLSQVRRRIFTFLYLSGLAAVVYVGINVLQLLILKTPLGP